MIVKLTQSTALAPAFKRGLSPSQGGDWGSFHCNVFSPLSLRDIPPLTSAGGKEFYLAAHINATIFYHNFSLR